MGLLVPAIHTSQLGASPPGCLSSATIQQQAGRVGLRPASPRLPRVGVAYQPLAVLRYFPSWDLTRTAGLLRPPSFVVQLKSKSSVFSIPAGNTLKSPNSPNPPAAELTEVVLVAIVEELHPRAATIALGRRPIAVIGKPANTLLVQIDIHQI